MKLGENKMKLSKNKWPIITTSLVLLFAVGSTIPDQNNPFEEAINVLSQEYNLDRGQLEVTSASHQVFFLFHTVSLDLKVTGQKDKRIIASLQKIPFGSYNIQGLKKFR